MSCYDHIAIKIAYKYLDDCDAEGAAFALRDTEIAKRLGLVGLFNSLAFEGAGVSEMKDYLQEVETALEEERRVRIRV